MSTLAGGHNGGISSERKKASGSGLGLLALGFFVLRINQMKGAVCACWGLEKTPEGEAL